MTVRTTGGERPTPDWSLWLELPRLALWKAVALSLDLEPDRLEISSGAWMSGQGGPVAVEDRSFNTKAQAAQFSKRRRIAAARLTGDECNDRAEVSIAEFLTLAIELQWMLPDQLAKVRQTPAMEPETTPPAPRVPRKVLVLPVGASHVQFGDLARLIADALYPDLGPGDERWHAAAARVNLDDELLRAVRDGSLPVLDPLTYGPHTFPIGDALRRAMVDVEDLRNWLLGTRKMTVEVPDSTISVGPAPEVGVAQESHTEPSAAHTTDFSVLAPKHRLVDAFGPTTGMTLSWFDNLADTPKLQQARKVKGQAGRGRTIEPWFCPYEVMKWLVNPARKKGKAMTVATGWRLLERHFHKVYVAHELDAPDSE